MKQNTLRAIPGDKPRKAVPTDPAIIAKTIGRDYEPSPYKNPYFPDDSKREPPIGAVRKRLNELPEDRDVQDRRKSFGWLRVWSSKK